MTDPQKDPRPATLKDLQELLAQADRPAEREKLVADPEGALRQAGLIPTVDAIGFLSSLGQAKFDETKQAPQPSKASKDGIAKAGEM